MLALIKPAALFALLLLTSAAHATYCANGAKDYPKCSPPNATGMPSPSSSSTASASAQAAAQAVGVGVGYGGNANSTAAGGNAQQQQGQSASLSSNDSSSARMYVLPSPVFTPPMARVECPTPRIENRAIAIGWGFVSAARGDTITDDCMLIAMRNAYVESCQYASAKQVQDRLTARALPGFTASTVVYLDLTREGCDALKAPPAPPARPDFLLIEPKSSPDPALVVKPRPKKAKPADTCLKRKASTDGLCMAPWNHSKKMT